METSQSSLLEKKKKSHFSHREPDQSFDLLPVLCDNESRNDWLMGEVILKLGFTIRVKEHAVSLLSEDH